MSRTRHPLCDLESPICEVSDMAEVTAHLIGEHIIGPHNDQREKGHALPLSEEETRQILFCIYHLQTMVTGLKADFYKRFDEGRHAG